MYNNAVANAEDASDRNLENKPLFNVTFWRASTFPFIWHFLFYRHTCSCHGPSTATFGTWYKNPWTWKVATYSMYCWCQTDLHRKLKFHVSWQLKNQVIIPVVATSCNFTILWCTKDASYGGPLQTYQEKNLNGQNDKNSWAPPRLGVSPPQMTNW